MSKFKIGDYLRIADLDMVIGDFDEDAIYEVVDIDLEDDTPVVLSDGNHVGFFKSELRYLEKVEIEPKDFTEAFKEIEEAVKRLSERIDNLEKTSSTAELAKKLSQAIGRQMSEKWEATAEEIEAELRAESLLGRKIVIEKAKKFVNDYCYENHGSVAFEIDRENKTTYARLLISIGSSYEVVETTKAVCGKKDVYNETLGKAIALGRLIGEDTSEFENAVQPLDYVVDQIVEAYNSVNQKHVGAIYKVEKDIVWIETTTGNKGYVYKNADTRYGDKNYKPTIIDDTYAVYS